MNQEEQVKEILARIKADGDEALFQFTKEFDDVSLSAIQVSEQEIERAYNEIDSELRAALIKVSEQIRAFHSAQLTSGIAFKRNGVSISEIKQPVDRVGCYVPGGRFAYPSTALMTTIPASVAGVPEVVICTPPGPDGITPRETLAAAQIAGVTTVYAIGGAQAIGALCYGTESVRPVDLIVGPGNSWVNEAKRQVFGNVGIDSLAGPTDVTIAIDDPEKIDMALASAIAQCEHGPDSTATIFATPRVIKTMTVETSNQISIKGAATFEEAIEFACGTGPEHLELYGDVEDYSLIKNSGAVFINTTSVVGDYFAGTNHVLPTNSTARFANGLRVDTFQRTIPIVSISETNLWDTATTIANAEGLAAHAEALFIGRS